MVGGYGISKSSLILRQPAKAFVPVAWLLAGPFNPAGFFTYIPWNEPSWYVPFDAVMWATSVAVPLSAGCAAALHFLRHGGFGFMTLLLITGLATMAGCAVTGPIYTLAVSVLREFGVYWTVYPVSNFGEGVLTSGTFIQLGLILSAVPLVPAAILLRVVAFRREPKKKKWTAASTVGF